MKIHIKKDIAKMDDITFLKHALKEIQKEQKKIGKKFVFDVEKREQKIKQRLR